MMKFFALFLTLFLAAPAQADGISIPGPSYVEGAWTPTLVGSTSGNWTLSLAVGSYEKIGRQVTIRFRVTASASNTPVGNIQIGGLPFTVSATANDNGTCFLSLQFGLTNTASYTTFGGIIVPADTTISIYENGSGVAAQNAAVARANATPTLIGYCNYHT